MKLIGESLPNLRYSERETAQQIKLYSNFLYFQWILLCSILLYSCVTCSSIYMQEFPLINCYPLNIYFKSNLIVKRILTPIYFIISIMLWYSATLPMTIGVYHTFHHWIQFRLLNDYVKSQLCQKVNSKELFNRSEQARIYRTIRKVVKWHMHLKR